MHCSFPGTIGKLINYSFKFNVSVFFMISGFFLFSLSSLDECKKIKKQISKIIKILSFSFLFYGIIRLLQDCFFFETNSLKAWLERYFLPLSSIPHKLVFGNFFNGTLWYLYALFWAYIILLITTHITKIKRITWLSPILLSIHIILRIYIKKNNYSWYDSSYFCSFILYALPFMLLGYYFAQKKQEISKNIGNKELLLFAIGGFLLQFIEYSIFKQASLFFGTVIYSSSLFLLAIKHPFLKINKYLNYIGEKLSMPIYIVHFSVILFLEKIKLSTFSSWIIPFIAIIISICLAVLWVYLSSHLKNLKPLFFWKNSIKT